MVLALGLEDKHVSADSKGLVSFAFVVLATLSTFAIMKSDRLIRLTMPGLKRLGLRDLDSDEKPADAASGHGARILLVEVFPHGEFVAGGVAEEQSIAAG